MLSVPASPFVSIEVTLWYMQEETGQYEQALSSCLRSTGGTGEQGRSRGEWEEMVKLV